MKVPIIFVPGIMGSRINLTSSKDKWDPDSIANMLALSLTSAASKQRILNFAGAGEIFTEPASKFTKNEKERKTRGWGGVRWASYGEFLEIAEEWKFGSNRTPIYVYGFDWRQPIVQLGCQMAADITGETVSVDGNSASPSSRFGSSGILGLEDADKCIIITHSMGGLVTRAALKACSTLQSKTVGVLHGVQPATGAPVMYRRMITGAYSPYDGTSFADGRFEAILGATGDDFGTLVSVAPGAMQLLPSDLYKDAVEQTQDHLISWTSFEENRTPLHWGTESICDTYARSHTDNPPGIVRSTLDVAVQTMLRTRIDGIRRFQQFIGDWKFTDKTWAFYGASRDTDYTVHFDLPPKKWTDGSSGGVLGIGATKVCQATDSSGNPVTLDYEQYINRNGYSPTVTVNAATGLMKNCFAPRGDGTVPEPSGSALFSASQTADVSTLKPPNYQFEKYRQFAFSGLEHEPAFRDSDAQDLIQAFIYYILGTLPRK
jgi:hypothetical protein